MKDLRRIFLEGVECCCVRNRKRGKWEKPGLGVGELPCRGLGGSALDIIFVVSHRVCHCGSATPRFVLILEYS